MSAAPAPVPGTRQREPMWGEGAGVLLLCPREEDRVRLIDILGKHHLKFHQAITWQEGAEGLRLFGSQVVICEAVLPDADWKQIVSQTALLRDAPRVIVISSQADDFLWAEVLNLGGYDVLPKPLVQDEVVRVVRLAWQNWKSERDRQGRQTKSLSERRTQNEQR